MNTRYSALVTLKKNKVQQSERLVQRANADLNRATTELHISYETLSKVEAPQEGSISKYIASRSLLQSARESIEHNKEWIRYAKNQVEIAREALKTDMIEHEKFKYLEQQEIMKIMKELKQKESKELDEIALMTYAKNDER